MFSHDARNKSFGCFYNWRNATRFDTRNSCRIFVFLAVPTMLAVTTYSLFLKTYEVSQLKGYELLTQSSDNLKLFFIGNIVAFVVAVIAIKFFIGIIKKYGFKPWGITELWLELSFWLIFL